MVLNNLIRADTGKPVSITIANNLIGTVSAIPVDRPGLPLGQFNGHIVFPGLINSHDHLNFNLFPQLGHQIYPNYVQWGQHIHKNYSNEIKQVLAVPNRLRTHWGLYKNLLAGVTTVLNHSSVRCEIKNRPISVFEQCHNLHSVQLDKYWKLRLNNPLKTHIPVVIHLGEGSDHRAAEEINTLLRMNFWRRDIIAVHGVAMSAEQATQFKALVWCPQSNFFLLNKTAAIHRLKANIPVLFGTDSALTGNWDIWDHIRMARKTKLLNDEELYQSLTKTPAKVWKLNAGEIAPGKQADLVIAKKKAGLTAMESFFDTRPEDILLVMRYGKIVLVDECMLPNLYRRNLPLPAFSKIEINGAFKFVAGKQLNEIHQSVYSLYPKAGLPFVPVTSSHQV